MVEDPLWLFTTIGGLFFILAWFCRQLLSTSVLDNIPGPPSSNSIVGHLTQLADPNGWEFYRKLSEDYAPGIVKLRGLLGARELYVYDPLALHQILVKSPYIYEKTPIVLAINQTLFGPGLISTTGQHHRRQRKLLNAAFSPLRLRNMIRDFYQVTRKARNSLCSKLSNGPQEVDMMQWVNRISLENIGQSGLGYSFDELDPEESSNPYTESIKYLLPSVLECTPVLPLLPICAKLGTASLRQFLVRFIPSKSIRRVRDMVNLMDLTALQILSTKKDRAEKKVDGGKDLIDILLRDNMKVQQDSQLPEVEILAQISTLIFAARDTTSSALARTLHILATHPVVQTRLRIEISEAFCAATSDLGLTELDALPYLDAFVKEMLRLHPSVPTIARIATSDTTLPLSTPVVGNDGKPIMSVTVPKGTTVTLGLMSFNRDKRIWGEDALDFRPERWMSPLPDSVINSPGAGIYSHMMSFSAGPHSCIGFQFARAEIKVLLAVLLQAIKFSPSEKEISWVMGITSAPSLDGKLQMPMSLELV